MAVWSRLYGEIGRIQAEESLRLYGVLVTAGGLSMPDDARSGVLDAWRTVARWAEQRVPKATTRPLRVQVDHAVSALSAFFAGPGKQVHIGRETARVAKRA